MSSITSLKIAPATANKKETLHINKRKREIKFDGAMYKFTDKDTKQQIVYLPSLELTGYGETMEKAMEMMNMAVSDLFDHFIELPHDKLQIELSRYGWKKTVFKNKEFSKLCVDIDGKLKDLNAEDDKVERLTLTSVA